MKNNVCAIRNYAMGGNDMNNNMAASLDTCQGNLDSIIWYGGRQGDLDGGTWHWGGKHLKRRDARNLPRKHLIASRGSSLYFREI